MRNSKFQHLSGIAQKATSKAEPRCNVTDEKVFRFSIVGFYAKRISCATPVLVDRVGLALFSFPYTAFFGWVRCHFPLANYSGRRGRGFERCSDHFQTVKSLPILQTVGLQISIAPLVCPISCHRL